MPALIKREQAFLEIIEGLNSIVLAIQCNFTIKNDFED